MRKWGKVLTFIAIALLAVCIGLTVFGGIQFAKIGGELLDDGTDVRGGTVRLEADRSYALYVQAESSDDVPSCRITAPDGETWTTDRGGKSLTFIWHSDSWGYAGDIDTKLSGDYQASCGGSEPMRIGRAPDSATFLWAVAGLVFGIIGGLGSGALLLAGIIMWAVGASNERKQRLAMGGYQMGFGYPGGVAPGQYAGQGYAPAGYGQTQPYGQGQYGQTQPYGQGQPYGQTQPYAQGQPYGQTPSSGQGPAQGQAPSYHQQAPAYGQPTSAGQAPAYGQTTSAGQAPAYGQTTSTDEDAATQAMPGGGSSAWSSSDPTRDVPPPPQHPGT